MKVWRKCNRTVVGPAIVKAHSSFTTNVQPLVISSGNSHYNSEAEPKVFVSAGTIGILRKGGIITFYVAPINKHDFQRSLESPSLEFEACLALVESQKVLCRGHLQEVWRQLTYL